MSIEGLREGLEAAGLDEGRHIALLLRNAEGDMAAARALERDNKVNVIPADRDANWRFLGPVRPRNL